ncbi:MAG: 4Fe-4S cluster-binding domain-containing protein [Clostridia bacterium]|nr:4Fe-4S cluster-binding domain-containing protein [Clostridia bacterium]
MKKLDVLGLPIVDHCNLNCKGCYHFCTKGQQESFVPYDVFFKDVKRFKELVDHVDWIKLYGGEPLLHPRLDDFVTATRYFYPYAEICLMTNGILVPTLSAKSVDVLKKADVKIDITVYPVMEKNIDNVKKFLEENGLRSNISYVHKFGKRFNKNGDSDIEASYKSCDMKICHYLQYGEFVMCPLPIFIRRYNELFNTDYNFDNDILNIYSDGITYEDIIEFSGRAHDSCRYCGDTVEFDWEIGKNNPPSADWEI